MRKSINIILLIILFIPAKVFASQNIMVNNNQRTAQFDQNIMESLRQNSTQIAPTAFKEVKISKIEDENTLDFKVSVYSNSAKDKIIINQHSNEHQITILLSDLFGEALKEEKTKSKKTQFDISELPAGIYFLKIEDSQSHKYNLYKINKIAYM